MFNVIKYIIFQQKKNIAMQHFAFSPISAKVDNSSLPIYREAPAITGTSAVISTGKFIYLRKSHGVKF